MIEATGCGRAQEFIRLMEAEWAEELAAHDGQFFVGNISRGYTGVNALRYVAGGEADIPDGRMSHRSVDLFLDIPDDVDPDRAAVASVVATYRRSDGHWWVGVAFGDEAAHWVFSPANLWDLAEEVCPL